MSNEDEANSVISNSENNDDVYDRIAGDYSDRSFKGKIGNKGQDGEFNLDRMDQNSMLENVQMLQDKLRAKEQLINRLREVMEKDDEVKQEMKNKISELRDNINTMKDRMNNVNDFDDEEIEDLLNRMDNKQNSEERVDPLMSGSSLYQLNINTATQGMLGNAMLNDYQVRIYLSNSKTCWGKFKITVDKILNWFVPFKSDMRLIFARFDRNISGIFQFFRFLFVFNIFVSLTSSYLLIKHFMVYSQNDDQTLCKMFLPCSILYSRFTSAEKNTYSFTFVSICVVMFAGVISNWTEFKRHDLLLQLFDSENIAFAKEVFNPWNWSTKDLDGKENNKQKLKNIFTIGVKETIIKDRIKNRSGSYRCLLISRRVFSFILSIIILLIDAGCVAGLYVLQAYLVFRDTDKTTNNLIDYVAIITPSVGLLIINSIVPLLLKLCIRLEKWDFNSTIIVQSIWRNYVAKLFTTGIVYAMVIMFIIMEKTSNEILGNSDFDFGLALTCSYNVTIVNDTQTIKSMPSASLRSYINYANCKEDEAASIFIMNLLADWLSRKLIPPIILFIRFLICRKCKNKKNFKSEYDDISAVASTLIFNIQIYLLIPFFPYILLISPLLLLIDFKYEVFMLKHFYDKPEKMTLQEKSGYFIMTLFTFTLIGIIIAFILFFVNSISHSDYMECYTDASGVVYEFYNSTYHCGPFIDKEVPKQTMYDSIASSPLVFTFYEFLANPLYILIFAFLLAIIIVYSLKVSNAFQFYIKEKKTESKIVESGMNEVIKKLRDQIRYLKNGVNKV